MNANTDALKRQAADMALQRILPALKPDSVVGIGTGSTVDFFIAALGEHKHVFDAAVASSARSEQRLRELGIPCLDLNAVDEVPFYIDGADEIDAQMRMIKGGGGALTREKILAVSADVFLCIADPGKRVKKLGAFPLAVEVLPMARGLVARALAGLGAEVDWRRDFISDNGNVILDARGLNFDDPEQLERDINQITGVVENGIFARRRADELLVAET